MAGVAEVRRDLFTEFTSEADAAGIMDGNVLDMRSAARCFEVRGASQEYDWVPFSVGFLKAHRGGILAAVPVPETAIRCRMMKHLTAGAYEELKQWSALFAGHTGVHWALLAKHGLPNSFGKPWEKQRQMVPPDREVATFYVCVTVAAMYYLETGKRIFEHTVRCYGREREVIHIRFFEDGKIGIVPHSAESPFTVLATEFRER